jgi:hypothetical protein
MDSFRNGQLRDSLSSPANKIYRFVNPICIMTARFSLINTVLGWGIFLVAALTYCSTIEPTTSFWDCGEYIACANKLEVGHPPGAPTFLLIGRFFALFAGDDVTQIAKWVNLSSALSSAFTILFMFWSLTLLGRRLAKAMGDEFTDSHVWAIFGTAIVGSLAYTFSDSFWFSAAEGEVYAMSSFFTSVVVWAALRWEADNTPQADRWLVFIAYMIGLSIGVHLLNLLAIPAVVFIVYFKRFNYSTRGLILTSIIAVVLLGVIQNGIIPGIVSGVANYELLFVNTLGLPFNSGTILFLLLLVGMIVVGLRYTMANTETNYNLFLGVMGAFFLLAVFGGFYTKAGLTFLTMLAAIGFVVYFRRNLHVLNTTLLSFAVLLIGYSSIFVLVIRSQANTPLDENNPENAISLLSYLNREQYGDWPLVYGPYYNAVLDDENPADDGTPLYGRNDEAGEYTIVDSRKQTKYNFAPELSTALPRMWETNQKSHVREYEYWGDVKKNRRRKGYVDQRSGETIYSPTMAANLKYMFNFQIGWMYFRYFRWNFVGRQNDMQGHRPGLDGGSMSGLPFLDNSIIPVIGSEVANSKGEPDSLKNNKARNNFYALPLILGLIGMAFHFSRDWKSALVVLLLFLFTGLSIVFYLNQYPLQPRERDYAYVGSFYAFAMWIGLGVYAIYHFVSKALKNTSVISAALATVVGLGIPAIMVAKGWDDHDRSHRYTARDFAKNYLITCDKNAILFTNGDNDTFPLWYTQEVENFRTDVRVLNLSLLNTDWYIEQARRKAYNSDPLPFSLSRQDTRQGMNDQVFFAQTKVEDMPLMSAREVMDMIVKKSPQAARTRQNKDDNDEPFLDTLYQLPTKRLYIPVDKNAVRANGTVPANTPDSLILDRVEWVLEKDYLLKSDLMVLDILATNNWKRPLYFAVSAGSDSYMGLEEYFQLEGLAYHLVPMKGNRSDMFTRGNVRCDTKKALDKIKAFQWGGLNDTSKSIYMDENNRRFTTNLRIQIMTLATFLNDDKDFKAAADLLDYSQQMMPEKNVPLEPVMVYMVDQYYRAGAMDKGDQLAKSMFALCEGEYKYYNSLAMKSKEAGTVQNEKQRMGSSLSELKRVASKNKRTSLESDFTSRMKVMGLNEPEQDPMQMPQQQQLPDSIREMLNQQQQMNAKIPDSIREKFYEQMRKNPPQGAQQGGQAPGQAGGQQK